MRYVFRSKTFSSEETGQFSGISSVVAAELRTWRVSTRMQQEPEPGAIVLDVDAVDADLLKATLRDRANFALLHCRYETSVKSYCRRRLDEADADDATQHIFLQAFSKLESCRGPSFRAWLFTIAHNAVIDKLRVQRPTTSIDERFDLASDERSPEELALEAERKQRLQLAIRALPAEQRAAIELRLAGLSGVECAAALGKTPDATRMLQHRAFGNLRIALADLSPEDDDD